MNDRLTSTQPPITTSIAMIAPMLSRVSSRMIGSTPASGTVDNTLGTADATNVSITDTINANVTFVDEAYGAGQDVSFSPGGFCNADAGDGDTDGCSLDGASLVVGNVNLAITVAFGTSLTISFQVLIPNL